MDCLTWALESHPNPFEPPSPHTAEAPVAGQYPWPSPALALSAGAGVGPATPIWPPLHSGSKISIDPPALGSLAGGAPHAGGTSPQSPLHGSYVRRKNTTTRAPKRVWVERNDVGYSCVIVHSLVFKGRGCCCCY